MKTARIHILWSLLCLSFLPACRKDLLHWQKVTRLETGTQDRLNRIVFAPSGQAYVCGGEQFDHGIVLYSRDGGDHWHYELVKDMPVGLYGLCVAPDGKVSACGQYSHIATSSPDSIYFTATLIPDIYEFSVGMAFPQPDKGIVINNIGRDSGSILLVNGAYQQQHYMPFHFGLNDICMVDAQQGYVAGYGAVMKTTDGGFSWKQMDVHSDNFMGLCCMGNDKVWTCGYNGSIYKSGNGGAGWTRLRNGNDLTLPRYQLQAILFIDEQHGYAVGEAGVVTYTDDGGKHWMEFDRFTDRKLLFIARCPDGSLITGGEQGSLYKLRF